MLSGNASIMLSSYQKYRKKVLYGKVRRGVGEILPIFFGLFQDFSHGILSNIQGWPAPIFSNSISARPYSPDLYASCFFAKPIFLLSDTRVSYNNFIPCSYV